MESVIGLSVSVIGFWETVIGLCGFGFWWVIRWQSSVCLGLWVWIWWWWCCWILGGGGGCCALGEGFFFFFFLVLLMRRCKGCA